jgi:hypothetical protein
MKDTWLRDGRPSGLETLGALPANDNGSPLALLNAA